MAKSKSTRGTLGKGLRQIDMDLLACRQTLLCAAEALAKAEGEGFEGGSTNELAAAAIRVVERCCTELHRIECAVDGLTLEVRP